LVDTNQPVRKMKTKKGKKALGRNAIIQEEEEGGIFSE